MLLPMKSFIRTSAVSLVVIVAVAILLPVLAVLQYRWLGEVSQAERERLQANIRTGAEQFRQDFNQEILRTVLAFQMETGDETPGLKAELAAKYDSWVSHAPYAKLVRAVLLAERSWDGTFRLSRFQPESGDLQACDWPAELVPWRDRIEHPDNSLPPRVKEEVERMLGGALRDTAASRVTLISNPVPVIADDVPAILIPFAPSAVLRAAQSRQTRRAGYTRAGYTIVEFDRDYIRQEFLPAIALKHFASDNRLDYNLAVVRQADPLKPLYQSDPLWQLATPATSDSSMEFFSLRMEDIRSLPLRDWFRLRPGQQSGSVILRRGLALNRDTGPTDSSRPAPAAAPRGEAGRWLLLVTHRAGSLEAAVARVRSRNLIVSGGVLLLLVASVALVAVLAQRSQRLARQQMVFVAGVSHELRTPLAVIRSAGDNLAEGVIADRPQVQHYGDLIRTEARRLSETLEQILEFAGIQSRRKTGDSRPVEIENLIETALDRCGLAARDSDFRVERRIERALPPVMGDPAALSGALQNLLLNAMKYSGDRRWVGIGARAKRTGNGREVEITIEDRGLGIAPSDLPHIFEPFYRGKGIVDAQIHGNGLGLSLVKHTVETHGGRVAVKSTLGLGSSFTVHLPIVEGSPRQSSTESPTGWKL